MAMTNEEKAAELALYDKLGNTLWDNKKYLYLMNCIYGLSDSKTYEIK